MPNRFRLPRYCLLALVALSFSGCDQPKFVPPEKRQPSAQSAQPPPKATSQNNLAANEVYLVRRISIPNESGVLAFAPGSKLTVLSRNGEQLTVSAEGAQFEVAATDITTAPIEARASVTLGVPREEIPDKQAPAPVSTEAETQKEKDFQKKTALEDELFSKRRRLEEIAAKITEAKDRRVELGKEIAKKDKLDPSSPEARVRQLEYKQLDESINAMQVERSQLQLEFQQQDYLH